ncbi:MAG: hypothetical protein SOT07_06500 [Paludibacteraceae bacterium]|nr:hypothetical protein [Paludibacteraceae bacterium]
MKKTITFVAALLLCVGAFAESYTLNFVEYSKTDKDSANIYAKGVEAIFGAEALVYVATIDNRENVFPARVGCGAKFGGQTKAGFIAFTLANPTEVDSIVISAAQYGDKEGVDGFKVINVTLEDTTSFTLSAGNKTFEKCVWKPAGEVKTIRINQTTANNQRFYVKSITIYPKKTVETAIEQTTESADSKKVLRNGQVLILREGKAYNLCGQEIAD